MGLRSKIDVRSLDQAVDGLNGLLRTLHICILGGIVWTLISLPVVFIFNLVGEHGTGLLITLIGWAPSAWAYNKLRKAYKAFVIEPLFEQLESSTGLHYSRAGSFGLLDFNRLAMFGQADDVTSEDCIYGMVDGIDFHCCEVKATKEYRDSKGRKRTSTIFKGEIYTIKMKERLKADVLISPDLAESTLGELGKFLQAVGQSLSDRKVVRMENPVFERLFKVVSDDDVGARYFLTPRFMERLTAARHLHKKAKFYLETQGSTIYLMIKGAPDKFEPHITGASIKSGIYKEIDAIETTLGIIKSLNLDLHHINVNMKKADAA